MGGVALLAAALAAMRNGSALAARGVFTSTLLVLLTGLLGVMVRRGDAAWAGFALFGWSTACFTFIPPLRDELRPQLISTAMIEEIARRLHELPPEPPPLPFQYISLLGVGFQHHKLSDGKFVPLNRVEFAIFQKWHEQKQKRDSILSGMDPQIRNAEEIGHLLLCLVCSVIGAVMGNALAPQRVPDGPSLPRVE